MPPNITGSGTRYICNQQSQYRESNSYFRCAQKPITVAERHRLSRRGDSQVGKIRPCFSAAKNHYILSCSKLTSRLELRGVEDGWNILDAFDIRNVGNNMKASANCNSITRPPLFRAVALGRFVGDNMTSSLLTSNLCNSGLESNMRP